MLIYCPIFLKIFFCLLFSLSINKTNNIKVKDCCTLRHQINNKFFCYVINTKLIHTWTTNRQKKNIGH